MQSSHSLATPPAFAARIVGCGALTGAGRGPAASPAGPAGRPSPAGGPRDGDRRLAGAPFVAIPEPRQPLGDSASHWLSLACADALAEARQALASLHEPRLGLLCGTSLGGMSLSEADHRQRWDAGGEAGPGLPVEPVSGWRAQYDGPATAVAIEHGASAGSLSVSTACSWLPTPWAWRAASRCWRLDVAVVAGVDVVSPFVLAGFQCLGAVDSEPSTPFGAARHGLNLGEAAVAFVMMRAEDVACDPGRIDLIGYGSSCDAHHLTRPDPSGAGLARAMRSALDDAGLTPEQVGLLSTHGTGTAFNDAMEAAAFAALFGDAVPPMHGAKPVAGHTLGAAWGGGRPGREPHAAPRAVAGHLPARR